MPPLSELCHQYLDNLDIGAFILDNKSNYVYVNDAYCRLISKSKEYCYSTSIQTLKKEGFLKNSVWDMVMEKRQTVHAVVTITDWMLEKTYDAITTGIPHFGPDGEIAYVFFTQESIENINDRVQDAVANKATMITSPQRVDSVPDFVAESPQMRHLLETIGSVAPTDASILINGPSGSGKEVLANHIHRTSLRRDRPLVVLNCGAIPESLMESELFGYEKGAFTGAAASGKAGVIEMADGGTLFLDEINSMPFSMQTKLLRVLETKTITRIGSTSPKKIDFRLICATNENMQLMVTQHTFRQDLFYRINVISVTVPPLSERVDDIRPLAETFLKVFCNKYHRIKYFSEYLLDEFQRYSWPGNVRELRNIIERMVVTSPPDEVCLNSFPAELMAQDTTERSLPAALTPLPAGGAAPTGTSASIDWAHNTLTLKERVGEEEKAILLSALKYYGSPAGIAKALKIDVSNVYKKLNRYGIDY